MRYVPIGDELETAVELLAKKWGDMIPGVAAIRGADGVARYKIFKQLTVADCEQLAEYRSRKAYRLLARFEVTRSKRTASTAADHILRARLYRWRYHDLLGIDPGERDMPFPIGTEQDIRKFTEASE